MHLAAPIQMGTFHCLSLSWCVASSIRELHREEKSRNRGGFHWLCVYIRLSPVHFREVVGLSCPTLQLLFYSYFDCGNRLSRIAVLVSMDYF